MLEKNIKTLLLQVKKIIQNLYKDNFEKMILYGSHARGENQRDSDIDVIVILNETNYNIKNNIY